jgi:hypothetical protein
MSGNDDVAYDPSPHGGWDALGLPIGECLVLGDPPAEGTGRRRGTWRRRADRERIRLGAAAAARLVRDPGRP